MNEQQRRIIRILQWILYPAALLALIPGLLALFGDNPKGDVAGAAETVAGVETFLFAALLIFFWIVFVALVIEFIHRLFGDERMRAHMGQTLVELRKPPAVNMFLLPGTALVAVAFLNAILFGVVSPEIGEDALGLTTVLAFSLFYAIGHFLLFAFLVRSLRNRPFFLLTDTGFVYEPGDVSPGLILWRDVFQLAETELLASRPPVSGPTLRRALVVTLRDPDKYIRRYTPLLQVLHRLFIKVIQAQTGGKETLVIASEHLGERYEDIRSLMADQVIKNGGSVTKA
jgi:hypothetical protein